MKKASASLSVLSVMAAISITMAGWLSSSPTLNPQVMGLGGIGIMPLVPLRDVKLTGTNYSFSSNATANAFQTAHDALASDPWAKRSYVTNFGATSFVSIATYNAGTNTLKAAIDLKLAIASNLSDLANAATARTNLSLVPGTHVQAYDADLTTYAGITPSANVQSLLGAASYSAMRTLLNLVPGTDVQAYDADLATLAALTHAKGKMLVSDGTNWIGLSVGANGEVIQANSTVLGGVNWVALPGGGDLLAANNLSDLANVNTAIGNLSPRLAYMATNQTYSNGDILQVSVSGSTTNLVRVQAATAAGQVLGYNGSSNAFTVRVYQDWQTMAYNGTTNIVLDFATYINQVYTFTNNVRITGVTNIPPGLTCIVRMHQDSTGSRVVQFDTNAIMFANKTVPTITTNALAFDIITLLGGVGGTNAYAVASQNH